MISYKKMGVGFMLLAVFSLLRTVGEPNSSQVFENIAFAKVALWCGYAMGFFGAVGDVIKRQAAFDAHLEKENRTKQLRR